MNIIFIPSFRINYFRATDTKPFAASNNAPAHTTEAKGLPHAPFRHIATIPTPTAAELTPFQKGVVGGPGIRPGKSIWLRRLKITVTPVIHLTPFYNALTRSVQIWTVTRKIR